MIELDVVQKDNNLNHVYTVGEVGPGGAYHSYVVIKHGSKESPVAVINFQKGPRNVEGSIDGVLDSDLLEIVKHRLTCFQAGDYACEENAEELEYLEKALECANRRVQNRAKRGVLGTYEK